MKKLSSIVLLTLLALSYQSIYAYDDESVITENSTEHSSKESCPDCPKSRREGVVDCRACCSEGRWVNSECARQCGGCNMYNDQAYQEYRDYP